MSKPLANKVALITGGSRGIGAAIARRLARDGADVAISYSASADRAEALVKELTDLGTRAAAFRADQADPLQVEALVNDAARRFGKLDILVNNAGVFVVGQVGAPDSDVAALERQFAINVGGVAAAVRAAVPLMSDHGRIISIGSAAADRTPWPGVADYSATKSAVSAYTRGWARDLAPRGITVNTVQPGSIDTEMNPQDGDFAAVQKAAIPLGRYGRPEEIAAAVAFLASADASFITGISLDVDGGAAA